MNINSNNNENTTPILSISNSNATKLVIRAFQELTPVIPERFEEYNKNIGLPKIKIDQNTFPQENINKEQLISYLSLDLEIRNRIISKTKYSLENDNTYPPDYYAITLIQSFCTILLLDFNTISFDYIFNFLNGFRLGWSCLPLHQDLYSNMFMVFYTRFLVNTTDREFLFSHLPQIDKIASEFSHCFLPYTQCLIDSCNYLFGLIFQDNDQIESKFNEKSNVFYDHFSFILKSINWKIEMYSVTHSLFENIIKILPIIKKENISIVYQFLSFLVFSVQSNSNSSANNRLQIDEKAAFAAISDLIDRFIRENKSESSIFSKDKEPQNETFQMKEAKYYEFLTDDSLTFSEDIQLKNYEYDPSLFGSLFDKKISTVAIISDFFYAITNFYSLPKTTFDVLIQICKPKIESGDLNYQSIIQLYVSKEIKSIDKLYTYFESYHLLNTVLFNQSLFDTSVSLFDYKTPNKPDNKVLMRIHLFYLIKNLIISKQESTEIFNSIIFLLNFYISSCQIFTEIIFLLNQLQIFDFFPENSKLAIIELISSEISVQHQWHSLGNKKAEICRPILLSIISNNTLNPDFNNLLLHSKDFVKSFFSLIFDPDIFSFFFELFCKFSFPYIQSAENDLFNCIQPAIHALMRSILTHFNQLKIYQDKYLNLLQKSNEQNKDKIQIQIGDDILTGPLIVQKQKRMIKVFNNYILVLQFLINDGVSTFISLFVKFRLFEMFTNIIPSLPLVTSSSDPSLISDFENLIILILDVFEKFANSPMIKKNIVPYNILIKPIQLLTITENIYNKLKKQVCNSITQFKSIERPEVLQLLIFSTENSDYFPHLLNEISIICRDSIWNCFSVFNSGILIKLLELIDLEEDQSFIITTSDQKSYDILEIILNLFCLVNIFVSSRQHLYAFIRLFRVFDNIDFINLSKNGENNKTLTPHLESYMNCFRTMFTIRSHIPSSFIHFSSYEDFVEMKSPSMKELMSGFTFSVWLLLDTFNEENNAFSVMNFKGKLTNLSIYLTKNSICMTFSNDKKVVFKDEIDISFPSLEWFNLTLFYDKENGLIPFVNGKKRNSIERPLNFLTEDFQTLKFHGRSDKSYNWMTHCQISILTILIGGYYNNNIASMAEHIYKFGAENVYSISSIPNIYSLYSAFKTKGDILINYKEGYNNTINSGNAKFKGSVINFVASFCQVFESSNGAAFVTALWSLIGLKYPDGNEEKRLISWISQVMETVCQYSDISQSQLIQINASQVISYFVENLPDERINSELWGCFNRLFKNATNPKFKRSLCTTILFNYYIWIRASFESATKIYSEWRNFIQTVSFEYWEKVSIKFMIDLLRYYLFGTQQNSETNSVVFTICLCMYDISLQHFSFEDAEAALNFCISVKSTQTLISILKLFENVFYNRTDINPYLFYDLLLKYTPLFFTEANETSKEEIMLLFQIIYEHENCNISILIDFIYCAIYQKPSRLQNSLFLMKQYMAKSIGTSSIDKASSFNIISTSSLILAIFSAIFVDPNERLSQITPFLGKISAFPDNQIKISNELNRYSILILIIYGIIIDLSVIPFLSAFLFRDINNLSLSFMIIDALERFAHYDFTNQLDIFISHCVSLLIANPTIPNRNTYFELFISKLFYHRKIGDFSWLERTKKMPNKKDINFFDFLVVAEKRKLNPEMNEDEQILSPSYIFGCLIQNNQWNELTLAKSIFQFLIILLNEDPNAVNPFLISCFIFCLTNGNIDINPYLSQLSQLITIMGTNFISEPFLLNMSLKEPNKQTDEFMKKFFNQSSITPSISLYAKTNEVFEESQNIVKKIINITSSNANLITNSNQMQSSSSSNNDLFFNSNIIHFISEFFTKLVIKKKKSVPQVQSFSMVFKKYINSDKSWKRLIHKLRNERSPLLAGSLMNKTRHYKRPSYFDFRFRPILLTPNEHFDVHSKASELALQQQKLQENDNLKNKTEKTTDAENDNILSSTDLIKISNQKINLNDDLFALDDNVKWSAPCVKINVLKKKNGTFSIFSKGYRFTDESGKRVILKSDSVLYIFWRWNLLIPNSIEIFMDNHKSYFFSFIEESDHSFVSNKLLKIPLPNKIFVQTKPSPIEIQNLHLTEKWLDYSMSTFDYLMALNMFSGRSFLNLSCYPVFPWILVDYASPSINIHSKPIYRDFKIPIGALNTQELERKKERMEAEVEAANAEFESGSIDNENYKELLSRSSFLFQTGYSNQFIVTYYMLRLEPFTSQHIALMDGRFDNPNRLFNSIPDSFMMLITTNSAFRELIPEFFFQPEFLINSDKFSFGMTLKKKIVNNVELPAWSKQPTDFIHKHVQALESDECGFEISNWIDLIWGYKQNGQNAVESNNTFDPHMYSNNHFEKDDVRTNHVRDLIGQIPIQLFENEHPKRAPRPNKNLPILPKKITLNLSGSNHETNTSSSFVVTSMNYECSSLEKFKIYSIHKNGKMFVTKSSSLTTNLSSNSFTSTCVLDEVLIPTDPRFISTCDDLTFVCSLNDGNGLLIFQPSVMKNGKCIICEEKPHIAAISCISISSDFIITGGCDASVVLWNWDKKKVSVIANSVVNNDTITAVCVSKEYGIAISCSRDGIMTIFRLPRLDFIRMINFNPQENLRLSIRRLSLATPPSSTASSNISSVSILSANRVMVTKGMGYIVAFLKNENEETTEKSTTLRSYTINGQLISSKLIECEVIDAMIITNKSMIDYILVLTDQPTLQELLLIDAYSLDILSTVVKNAPTEITKNEINSEQKITKFCYHEDAGIIVLAYDNSEFAFLPFLLP